MRKKNYLCGLSGDVVFKGAAIASVNYSLTFGIEGNEKGGVYMIDIFYKSEDKVLVFKSEENLKELNKEDVLWIDLLSPSSSEKRATEAFLGTEIQSRAHAEEIESSSRYFETDKAIFANTNFITPGSQEYNMAPVSFTLLDDILTTVREFPLRSITELQRKIVAMPKSFLDGYSIFLHILDQRVDLDADMIELMSKEISQYSKRINDKEDINEDFLLDINQLQENAMILRENIVDKQRLISSFLKSNKYPFELENRFGILLQDVVSLIKHTDFSFERLEYLQNTAVGLINLEQNTIMKIFTLVSLLLMPPTLVTSFYGMNVKLPLEKFSIAGYDISWILILVIMILSFVLIILFFRIKKWM